MKRLIIDVDDKFHKQIKITATKLGISIKRFITKLIEIEIQERSVWESEK